MPESRPRLYLDNAATSFPKPARVHEAMLRYATQVGGTAGRGTYAEAREGARLIRQCRERICRLIGAASPDHIVFTLNTTDALNLAIKGVVSARRAADPGSPIHLVTTEMDHNSVLRPFNAIADPRGHWGRPIEWTCIPADPATGVVDPAALRHALRPTTALVAISQASNVTGTIQPLADLAAVCRGAGVPILVDAAQSLGHIPVDVGALGVDLLAFPGHKGLLGPLGTGGLYIRPGMEDHLAPLREGGTGSASEQDTQPATLPDRYEPGSQNAPGIVGLSEAVAFALERGHAHWSHDRDLAGVMLDAILSVEHLGLRLLGPRTLDERVGVFSMVPECMPAHELAIVMESQFGILGRAGLHCAPRAHRALGSRGAYRLSPGPFVTPDDIRYVRDSLAAVAAECAPAHAERGTSTQ